MTLTISALVLLLVALPVGAAPVTSGFISGSAHNDFAANVDLSGENFSLTAFDPLGCPCLVPTSFVPDPRTAQVGDALDLSTRVVGSDPRSPAVLTWDGIVHSVELDLLLSSASVVRADSLVTVPFTLSGTLTSLTGDTTWALTGEGITTAQYLADLRSIRFDFHAPLELSESGNPVLVNPEPSSLLLLAGGIPILWRRLVRAACWETKELEGVAASPDRLCQARPAGARRSPGAAGAR